jgi:hypothetical protein
MRGALLGACVTGIALSAVLATASSAAAQITAPDFATLAEPPAHEDFNVAQPTNPAGEMSVVPKAPQYRGFLPTSVDLSSHDAASRTFV